MHNSVVFPKFALRFFGSGFS